MVPADDLGPVKGFFLFAQRNTPTGSDITTVLSSLPESRSALSTRLIGHRHCLPPGYISVQMPADCFVNVSAIERNPREPAVIFLC